MKKLLTYTSGLIALYLAVANTGSATLIKNGSAGGVSVIKALQGR